MFKCTVLTMQKVYCMTWVKPSCRSNTQTSFYFPNSSSIVSCPGFSSWDFKTPCSLIFHHGNVLTQRKWGCSAQHHAHTHQPNLSSDSVQKEDQTWLTVEQRPHELWNDRRWKGRTTARFFSHLYVTLSKCRMFSDDKSHDKAGLHSTKKVICLQCGQTMHISEELILSPH